VYSVSGWALHPAGRGRGGGRCEGAVTNALNPAQEEMAMPTRRPKKKRGAAGARGKTSRARAVPSKRKKASAKKQPARTGSPARATKKVGTKRVGAKRAIRASTKAQAGTQP